MKWHRQLKERITRNWKEKLLALLLAFVFWYLISIQVRQPLMSFPPDRASRAGRL